MMHVAEKLRRSFETPRPVADLLPWVERQIERIGSTREGTTLIRLRRGLAKQLVEEALPIGIFTAHHFNSETEATVRLVIGNQNYDAVLEGKELPFSRIEVTQAHEGENEHLRMLALERDGHVSTFGPVRKTGTKATGITVDVEGVALSHTAITNRELQRLGEAIERKIGREYRPQTALVVVFDDYISMRDDEDRQALRDFVEPFIARLDAFCWLAVVGWSQRTILEFDLRRQ